MGSPDRFGQVSIPRNENRGGEDRSACQPNHIQRDKSINPFLLPLGIECPVLLELFQEFQDICARIANLIELFGQADIILARALDTPLTRHVLWPQDAGDETDDG